MTGQQTIQEPRWDAWAGDAAPDVESVRRTKTALRWLLYLYLFLWVFEGALRKWVMPSMANPLLIVRDPVVVLIYVFTFIGGIWPKTVFLPLLLVLTCLFAVGGFLAETSKLSVMIYGLRSNFMHFPLIFVIPRVFDAVDVRRIGRWLLFLAVPMVILMTLQFQGGPSAWVNAGAGKGAAQLDSAMGKVRASGTFSFVVGTVCYFSLVAAYLLYGQTTKKAVGLILSIMGAGSLVLAGTVSGSRSLIAAAAVSFAFFIVGLVLHPASMVKAARIVVLGAVAWVGISAMDIFKESHEVMSARIENAKSAGTAFERLLSFFEFGLTQTSMFGKGLGKGTNVGAALLGQRGDFLLAEDEWKRITQESGYLFGPLFIFYRVALFVFLLTQAMKAARKGNMLPICLLGACGINVLTGQFGVPTMQGFTCFTAGMVLASCDPLVGADVKMRDLKLLAESASQPRLSDGADRGPAPADARAPHPGPQSPHSKPMPPVPRKFKPVRPDSKAIPKPSTAGIQDAPQPKPIKRLGNPNPFIVRPSQRPAEPCDETNPKA